VLIQALPRRYWRDSSSEQPPGCIFKGVRVNSSLDFSCWVWIFQPMRQYEIDQRASIFKVEAPCVNTRSRFPSPARPGIYGPAVMQISRRAN